MSYINNFPLINYKFGNNENTVAFQNISIYADVVDQIKDNVTVYKEYTILENMRPDQVSYELYGTTEYYWTFFLLNDNIREQGWPLSQVELLAQCQRDFPGTTLTTSTNLVEDLFTGTGAIRSKILPGTTIVGQSSGATGLVQHRHLDLGQLVIKGKPSFLEGETAYLSTDVNVNFTINSKVHEYLSTHHWEDANGNYVDLIDANGNVDITGGALNTEVTQYDRYVTTNNSLKEIKVLREGVAGSIVNSLITAINE